MREFFQYFLVAFVVFVVVGFISGWRLRKDKAAEKLYPLMEVVNKGNQYFLKVQTSSYSYLYDVDKNSIEDFNESLAVTARYEENSLTRTTNQHNEIVETVGQLLGPTAGVSVSVYQVFNAVKKPRFWSFQNFKKNVSLVIGSVTGYLIGKWIGSNFRTSPESDLALEILNDDMEMWKKAEHIRLKASLMEIQTTRDATLFGYNNVGIVGNDPVNMCNCSFGNRVKDELQALIKRKEDLTSTDFVIVDELYGKYHDAKNSDAYNEINRMSTGRTVAEKSKPGTSNSISKSLGYSESSWLSNCQTLCALLE